MCNQFTSQDGVASAYATLAEMEHGWDDRVAPEDTTDYTGSHTHKPLLDGLQALDGETFAGVVESAKKRLGPLEAIPTQTLIALYYQIDWELRTRLG